MVNRLSGVKVSNRRAPSSLAVQGPSTTMRTMWRPTSGSRVIPAVALVTFVALLAWLPASLLGGGVPAGHDAGAHLTYAHLFDHALREGQLPVRWVEWVAPGRGQPLFNTYQPGFYYLVSAVHVLVPSLTNAIIIAATLLWWGGAAAMAVVFRRLGTWPALAAAALFATAPYLVLDVYVRMALPELAAIAVAPMVLASLDWLARRPAAGGGFLCVALATALMLLLHLPSVLLLSPMLGAFALWRAMMAADARAYLRTVAAGVALGVGLAAFYVLPALAERDAVHMHELTSDYFDFREHFLEPRDWVQRRWGFGGSNEGRPDDMAPQVGTGQLVAILASVVALGAGVARRRRDGSHAELAVWLASVIAGLLLTTRLSLPVWEAIGPLAYVQFPWRALMVVVIGAAALGALSMAALASRWQAAVLLVGMLGLGWTLHGRLEPRDYVDRRAFDIDNPWWRHGRTAAAVAFREPAYRPLSVVEDPGTVVGRWRVEGDAGVQPLDVRDHRMTLLVDAPGEVRLTFHTPYVPGWEIRVDGQVVVASIDDATGFMSVAVPAGNRRVDVRLRATPVRAVADGVSLASVGVLGWLAVRRRSRTGR